MLIKEDRLPGLENYPQRAWEFTKIFMRFEFALKAAGFVRARKYESAEVDWNKLQAALGREFYDRVVQNKEIGTLIRQPPSHQIVVCHGDQCRLDWREAEPVQNLDQLLGAVRRVRNNLFHGGKSGDIDHARNDDLIAQAIIVIELALNEEDDTKFFFDGIF